MLKFLPLVIAFILTHYKVTGDCLVCACDPGWFSYRGNCYRFFDNNGPGQSWQDAENTCQTYSAHLASIHDAATNAKLANFACNAQHTWIGLTCTGVNGVMNPTWTDGTTFGPTDYKNWGDPSEPKLCCTYFVTDPLDTPRYGEWFARNCAEKKAFICEKPLNMPSNCRYCPATDKCYCSSFHGNRGFGINYCASLGGDSNIASVHSLPENDCAYGVCDAAYFQNAQGVGGGLGCFIGGNDFAVQNVYIQEDGSNWDFTYWNPGCGVAQPDHQQRCPPGCVICTAEHFNMIIVGRNPDCGQTVPPSYCWCNRRWNDICYEEDLPTICKKSPLNVMQNNTCTP